MAEVRFRLGITMVLPCASLAGSKEGRVPPAPPLAAAPSLPPLSAVRSGQRPLSGVGMSQSLMRCITMGLATGMYARLEEGATTGARSYTMSQASSWSSLWHEHP